ncbi:MAG: ATP-dependent zinc metalloprotease FtsH [Planctomycetota bacterium]
MADDPRQNGSNPRPEGDGSKTPQAPPPVKLSRGLMSWMIIIGLLIMLFVVLNNSKSGTEIKTWDEFVAYIDPAGGKINEKNVVQVKSDRVQAQLREGTTGFESSGGRPPLIYTTIDPDNREWFIKELNAMEGIATDYQTGQSLWISFLLAFGPFILIILLIWYFIARSMRSAGAGPGGMLGNFGKSRHRITSKDSVNVKFGDVAGIEEAKEELTEIVEFLKNPKKFQRLGGRIPRGVLLIGPPGCGKTLLAKAIAGEADVPFFSISGSDFVEMFVGVGASRVRDLFKQAKENSPCIIFLDEIDAVGRRRGGGFTTGGHDEREQTLNAILVEMDGFEASDQVIVIAATNRADVLDPALTRPGRFDRQVHVQYPDIVGRRAILEVHSKKVKIGPDVDLERLARGTPMFSGADLAAVINEAAIIATMGVKDFVEMADLEEARDKVRFGRARKSRKIEEQERIATAYHEAGHAVVQALMEESDPIHKVTIIPRGNFGGATFSLPEKDRYGYGRKYLLATMRVLCGGRIAEERRTDDISSGAGQDIQMATQYARHMVLEWGMSDRLGFVNYAGSDTQQSYVPERDYSDETARIIDEEVRRLTDDAYVDAKRMLTEHWEKVVAIAEALLKYETLTGDDIDRLMKGERLDKPTVAELLQAEAAKSAPPAPTPTPTDDRPDEEPSGGMMPSPA